MGDHGIYLKGPYFYHGAARVPRIISWASVIRASQRSQAFVGLTDLVPTLLEGVGLPLYPGMRGRPLWPLLTGQADINTRRDDTYSEYCSQLPHAPKAYAAMVRTRQWKLVAFHGLDRDQLYDLANHGDEVYDVWHEPPTRQSGRGDA